MGILFETIKGLFFVFSIVLGLFFIKGDQIQGLSTQNFQLIGQILTPGYLVLTGLVIGYIIGVIILAQKGIYKKDPDQEQKIYIKSFLGGLTLGILLAVIYIFLSP